MHNSQCCTFSFFWIVDNPSHLTSNYSLAYLADPSHTTLFRRNFTPPMFQLMSIPCLLPSCPPCRLLVPALPAPTTRQKLFSTWKSHMPEGLCGLAALYQSQIDIGQHMHGHALDFTYEPPPTRPHAPYHHPPTQNSPFSPYTCFKSAVSEQQIARIL